MFKQLLIGLELSDYDIITVVHTWSTVEENHFVHNAVVEAVIDGMYKSEEEGGGGVKIKHVSLNYQMKVF